MLIAQIQFEILEKDKTKIQSDTIYSFLGNLLIEGRILDRDFGVFQKDDFHISIVNIPEKDAFNNLTEQKYIKEDLEKLKEIGLSEPTFEILGKEIECSESCACKNPSAYVLFTNYLAVQSPIKCFDCGFPLPLYRIKQTEPQQLRYALSWQNDYKACDLLQMHGGFGERFGISQMSKLDSGLTQTGLKICAEIKNLTNKNCYYYLYRYNGRSEKKEAERKCPSCGGEWLLSEPIHDLFDFRCDKCHLLSNIAFSLR